MRKGLMTFICTVLTMWCMGARAENKMYITIDGQRVSTPANGLYIKNGNKIIL